MGMTEHESVGYVHLISGNNREAGRVLLGEFCSLIDILMSIKGIFTNEDY